VDVGRERHRRRPMGQQGLEAIDPRAQQDDGRGRLRLGDLKQGSRAAGR
jgi:hypothetical protein